MRVLDTQRINNICESARKRLNKWGGRWVDRLGPSSEANPTLPPDFGRTADIFEYFRLMQVEYLMPGKTGETLDSLAKNVAALVEDYFFGDWRTVFDDPVKLRREWFDELRFGMLAGLLLSDRRLFQRILQFPTFELAHDDGGWDRTPSDNQVYLQLCLALRSNEAQPDAQLSGSRPKALQKVISSIRMRDEKIFAKTFASYLAWYRKHEHEDRGNMLICLDGSILLLLAREFGLPIKDLWQHDSDFLVAPEL